MLKFLLFIIFIIVSYFRIKLIKTDFESTVYQVCAKTNQLRVTSESTFAQSGGR